LKYYTFEDGNSVIFTFGNMPDIISMLSLQKRI